MSPKPFVTQCSPTWVAGCMLTSRASGAGCMVGLGGRFSLKYSRWFLHWFIETLDKTKTNLRPCSRQKLQNRYHVPDNKQKEINGTKWEGGLSGLHHHRQFYSTAYWSSPNRRRLSGYVYEAGKINQNHRRKSCFPVQYWRQIENERRTSGDLRSRKYIKSSQSWKRWRSIVASRAIHSQKCVCCHEKRLKFIENLSSVCTDFLTVAPPASSWMMCKSEIRVKRELLGGRTEFTLLIKSTTIFYSVPVLIRR